MRKIIIALCLFLTPVLGKAATQIYIPSTSTYQGNSSVINIASGTIRNFRASTFTVTNSFVVTSTTTNLTVRTLNVLSSSTLNNSNFTGTSLFPDGTSSAPGIAFTNQTSLGIYRDGSGLNLKSNGRGVVIGNTLGSVTVSSGSIVVGDTANVGAVQLFPGTSNGSLTLSASDNANGTAIISVTNASQSGARTYTIPDATKSANFIMSEGAQTSNSTNTFTGTQNLNAAAGNPIHGTNTNDSASSGFYGEFLSSSCGSTSIGATGTYQDAVAIALTAGDWDIEATIDLTRNGATFTSTDFDSGIGDTTGNSSSGLVTPVNNVEVTAVVPTTFTEYWISIPRVRVSLASPATRFLKIFVDAISVGTAKYKANMTARRAR